MINSLMRLGQVFQPSVSEFHVIRDNCSQFLHEAGDFPLAKQLPSSYDDVHRVKVRKRRSNTSFADTFNQAFENEFSYLRQRAIFAHTPSVLQEGSSDEEPFYIFPVDGYRYLFSTEVTNSTQQYQTVFESILGNLEEEIAEETLRDLLKFTYKSTDLCEGINANAEIILYGVPCFYAVRSSIVEEYVELIDHIIEG